MSKMSQLFKQSLKNAVAKGEQEHTITLDEEQDLAVHTDREKVLVNAGAGSGKTRVITERVKYLLDQGVEPSSIVCITFTNMASEEMKIRLKKVRGIGDTFIGTIHSFANKVMKNSGKHYTLLNDDIENMYMKELIKDYCSFLTFEKYLDYKDLKSAVELGMASESQLNNLLRPSEQAELSILQGCSAIVPQGKTTDDYPTDLPTICKERGVITFDELLEMATDYFNELGVELEHVLVDEFQDVGTLEYSFIQSLNSKHYFFVGDDWQAIYGFKGGNVRIMLSLMENPDFAYYTISKNYRTQPAILRLADKVIRQVKDRIDKEIIYTVEEPEDSEPDIRSKELLPNILDSLAEEPNLSDWFILCRSNKDIALVSSMLRARNIKHTTFKREGLSLEDLNNLMQENSVKLLTVHVSKGLENKNVILYGNFPIIQPHYMRNDEERKVMYVGITRAREYLLILN